MTDQMVHAHGPGVKPEPIETGGSIERDDGPELIVRRFGSTDAGDAGHEVRLTWPRLCDVMRDPPRAKRKDRLPLLKLAAFGDRRNARGSFRHNANIDLVYGIEGDYDQGVVTPADARERLAHYGVRAIVYTTPSHTSAAPRWRVLAPLARPCSVAERAACVSLLNGALGGVLAAESWTASQPFYFGRIEGGEYEVHVLDGLCIDDLDAIITPIGKPRASTEAKPSAAVVPIAPSAERAEVDALLAQLDPSCGYDTWYRAGMAAQSALGDEGLDAWDAWSAGSHKYPGREKLEEKFRSFKPGGTVTIEWLRAQVRNRPASPEEFDIVEAPAPKRSAIVFRQVAEIIAERREPEWLIPDVLEANVLHVIAGPRGSLKSFVLCHWLHQVALRGHPVVLLNGEGAGFDRRSAAWFLVHGGRVEPCSVPIHVLERTLRLNDPGVVRELVAAIKALDHPPRLIAIDTFSKYSAGIDENDNSEVAAFLERLAVELRDRFRCTVLLVAHSGHSDPSRPRGASSLMANNESESIVVRADPTAMDVLVTRERFKDTPSLPPLAYRAEVVDLGRVDRRGQPVTSLVLREVEAPSRSRAARREPRSDVGKKVLRVLADLLPPDGAGVHRDELVAAVAEDMTPPGDGKRDLRRQHAARALDSLREQNFVEIRDERVTPR